MKCPNANLEETGLAATTTPWSLANPRLVSLEHGHSDDGCHELNKRDRQYRVSIGGTGVCRGCGRARTTVGIRSRRCARGLARVAGDRVACVHGA